MKSVRLGIHILRIMWRVGLIRLSLSQVWRILKAWRRTRGSFATLAAIAQIRTPHHIGLVDEQGELTFEELYYTSVKLARYLVTTYQIKNHHRAAILCRNQRSFVISIIALTHLGIDTLPLGTDQSPATVKRTLSDQEIFLILYDQEFEEALAHETSRHGCCVDLSPPLTAPPSRSWQPLP